MIESIVLAAALQQGATHTVQPGETLSSIAASAGETWQRLYAVNRGVVGSDPNLIYAGQVLRLHGDAGPYHALSHASHHSAGGRTWGVTYGYPNKCGDGDGDGWDVNCATRSAPVSSAPAGNHAVHSSPITSVPGGSTAIPAWASCIVQRESGGNARAVNSVPGYIGNGGGLFGDLTSTWNNYDGYPQPFDAPASVQIAFNDALSGNGSNLAPWAADGCPGT